MAESAVVTAEDLANQPELFGHPKGLYVCFATELWERFSFYGMKYLLLLYLTKYHLFTDTMGLNVLGSYAGLIYALPLAGGMIADRYLGETADVAGALATYTELFEFLMWAGVGVGIFMLLISPLLTRWMHGIH